MAEMILIFVLMYALCGVISLLLSLTGEDWDTYEVMDYLIAWPPILVGVFIKTVIKIIRNIKE